MRPGHRFPALHTPHSATSLHCVSASALMRSHTAATLFARTRARARLGCAGTPPAPPTMQEPPLQDPPSPRRTSLCAGPHAGITPHCGTPTQPSPPGVPAPPLPSGGTPGQPSATRGPHSSCRLCERSQSADSNLLSICCQSEGK